MDFHNFQFEIYSNGKTIDLIQEDHGDQDIVRIDISQIPFVIKCLTAIMEEDDG